MTNPNMIDESSEYIEVKARIRRKRILRMAYNQSPTDGTKIPAVRFSGSYLSDLGFEVGGKYELEVNTDSTITLRPILENDMPAAMGMG